jgi:hypothetical protein
LFDVFFDDLFDVLFDVLFETFFKNFGRKSGLLFLQRFESLGLVQVTLGFFIGCESKP